MGNFLLHHNTFVKISTRRPCFFIFLCSLIFALPSPAQDIPVFPGAEGFGTTTPAGRGGRIIKVTNLNSDGPGSFVDAVTENGPRIVVFEVGGVINVKDNIDIRNGNLTIAGQTAPSPGITITGATFRTFTNDVLIRHIRIRPGEDPEGPNPRNRSCIRVWDGSSNIVLDHCSFSWAVDENVTIYYKTVENVTVSNCITSEALDQSIHPEGGHSKGLIVGYHSQNVTIRRNLFAHNGDRNPLIKGDCPSIVINNFMYNPIGVGLDIGEATQDVGSQPARVSAIGNVLKATSQTYLQPGRAFIYVHVGKSSSRLYLEDNVSDRNFDVYAQTSFPAGVRVTKPEDACWITPMTILPSSETIPHVLANCGARPKDRDEIDTRIVNEAINGSGRMIDSPDDVGGMPQHPETNHTLAIPDNPNGDDDNDGYTNVEEWLHEMAAAVEGPVDIGVRAIKKRPNQKSDKLNITQIGQNTVSINLPSSVANTKVELFSAEGSCIAHRNHNATQPLIISNDQLASGVYWLTLTTHKGTLKTRYVHY